MAASFVFFVADYLLLLLWLLLLFARAARCRAKRV